MLGVEAEHEVAEGGGRVGGDHREWRLAGALPDEIVAAGRVDRGVVAQAAQAAAVAEIERIAVEADASSSGRP